jgi:hypothetical protein
MLLRSDHAKEALIAEWVATYGAVPVTKRDQNRASGVSLPDSRRTNRSTSGSTTLLTTTCSHVVEPQLLMARPLSVRISLRSTGTNLPRHPFYSLDSEVAPVTSDRGLRRAVSRRSDLAERIRLPDARPTEAPSLVFYCTHAATLRQKPGRSCIRRPRRFSSLSQWSALSSEQRNSQRSQIIELHVAVARDMGTNSIVVLKNATTSLRASLMLS